MGGRWASMAELANLVCKAAGVRPPRLVCPFGLARGWAPLSTAFCRLTGRAPLFTSYTLKVLLGNRCVSHARAQRVFGYGPRDLEQTVRDTLMWFRENGFFRS